MKAVIKVEKEVNFVELHLRCGVRYWEDGTINGVEDEKGDLTPFRNGDNWCPVIDIDSGIIKDWPKGTIASIHYKVCDDGTYTLIGDDGYRLEKDGYVPDMLDITKEGYGDYVILSIDESGKIENWPTSHNIDDFMEFE